MLTAVSMLLPSNGRRRGISSILIGSCLRSIKTITPDSEALVAEGGRLRIDFINYEDVPGSPGALLSADLTRLEFQ